MRTMGNQISATVEQSGKKKDMWYVIPLLNEDKNGMIQKGKEKVIHAKNKWKKKVKEKGWVGWG
jgi:hypothetical protein